MAVGVLCPPSGHRAIQLLPAAQFLFQQEGIKLHEVFGMKTLQWSEGCLLFFCVLPHSLNLFPMANF